MEADREQRGDDAGNRWLGGEGSVLLKVWEMGATWASSEACLCVLMAPSRDTDLAGLLIAEMSGLAAASDNAHRRKEAERSAGPGS